MINIVLAPPVGTVRKTKASAASCGLPCRKQFKAGRSAQELLDQMTAPVQKRWPVGGTLGSMR